MTNRPGTVDKELGKKPSGSCLDIANSISDYFSSNPGEMGSAQIIEIELNRHKQQWQKFMASS